MGVINKISDFFWKDVKPQFIDTKHPACLKRFRIVCAVVLGLLNLVQLVYPLFFIHMTNWGLTFVSATFILLSCNYKWSGPRLAQWTHLIFEISYCFEFVIVFVFWIILFWPYYEMLGYEVIVYSLYAHFGLLVLLLIDYGLSWYEFYRRHLILCYTLIISYGLINIFLTLYEFEVYPVLTYRNTWSYLAIAFIVVLICSSFEVLIAVNKCRARFDVRRRTSSEG